MIEISHLSKRYHTTAAVDDATFTARPGRVTGFLGPNGAGKSTTLRILLGLSAATSGTATIDGRRYRDLEHPLRTVGALLDGAGAVPERRAVDHLRWVAQSNRIPRARVDEVLELVDLTGARRQRVRTFSLGMTQRLGIATALLGDPQVVVLDEPTNGLDPAGIRWIRTLLRDFAAQGRTVLVSSHQMAEMSDTVDDLVIIDRGRVVVRGTLDEVVAGHLSLEEAFFAALATGAAR
ncbi:ABC transporter [Cellulomonas sp. A375-1]|uniref:ABC transporter ATP-binding protein n=1 Tax=Cellulomonas sp. A375-1 TaxID=1672219 RepID=UPI00065271CB|nr:ATP-binding cassette domain-containing protein [Cellulomonas sp. A375-1]KMM45055.1 ABC transporter [Cellulomonas sp. A375-1]